MQQIFQSAYRDNIWGDPESVSGPGSGVLRTAAFRDQVPALLEELKARSLIDAGCGDFNWIKEIRLSLDWYLGVEIVPDLVERNRQIFGDPVRRFVHGNIALDELPQADVILCRDCLVHFSLEDAWAALRNFKRSGSAYLLTTTFIEHETNLDIETGGWRPLNMERPPFRFPSPLQAIDEKCLHSGGIYADKRLALWRLADIRA
jgi:hypothetical protein